MLLKRFLLSISMIVLACVTQAQIPTPDSLKTRINQTIKSSPLEAFQNNNMNIILRSMANLIDSARLGTLGSVGVDSIFSVNDSTIRYHVNGTYRNVSVLGRLQAASVPHMDTLYKVNDSTLAYVKGGFTTTISYKGVGSSSYTPADGSETKITTTGVITKTGTGTTGDPYNISCPTCGSSSDSGKFVPITVAQLKALATPQILYPYYITDKGEEGFFYYDASDVTSTNNGGATNNAGTVIVNGTKRFKRSFSGTMNITWFGGVADYSSSGTTMSGTNNTPALDTMLKYANARQLCIVPAGNWYFQTQPATWGTKAVHLEIFGNTYHGASFIRTQSNIDLDHQFTHHGTAIRTLGLASDSYQAFQAGTGTNYDALLDTFINVQNGYHFIFQMNYVEGFAVAIRNGAGSDANQQIQDSAATGGTFTLTFNGLTTGAIAYNATASTVQTALNALSGVQTGDFIVTGGPLPGTAVNVQDGFGQFRGTALAFTGSNASLTGTGNKIKVTRSDGAGGQENKYYFEQLRKNKYGLYFESTNGHSYNDKNEFRGGRITAKYPIFYDGGRYQTVDSLKRGASTANSFYNVLLERCVNGVLGKGVIRSNQYINFQIEGGLQTGIWQQDSVYNVLNNVDPDYGGVTGGNTFVGGEFLDLSWLKNPGKNMQISSTPIIERSSGYTIATTSLGGLATGRITLLGSTNELNSSVRSVLINQGNIDYINFLTTGFSTDAFKSPEQFAYILKNGVEQTVSYSGQRVIITAASTTTPAATSIKGAIPTGNGTYTLIPPSGWIKVAPSDNGNIVLTVDVSQIAKNGLNLFVDMESTGTLQILRSDGGTVLGTTTINSKGIWLLYVDGAVYKATKLGGSASGGDVSSNITSSQTGQIALYSGTTGKLITNNSSAVGYVKLTTGGIFNTVTTLPIADIAVAGGSALQALRINAAGTGLEFYTPTTGSGTGNVTSVSNSSTNPSALYTMALFNDTSGKVIRASMGNGYVFTTAGVVAQKTTIPTTDISGTLPTTKGGTGLTTLGTGLQVLRVNAAGTGLEYATIATGSGSGVSSMLAAGTSPNANGATISGTALQLQAANKVSGVYYPGIMSTINQTFGGTKTFDGTINLRAATTVAGTAPIVFASSGGAKTNTDVAGQLQYDDSALYITTNANGGSLTREKILTDWNFATLLHKSIPISSGGTGLSSVGNAGDVLKVNDAENGYVSVPSAQDKTYASKLSTTDASSHSFPGSMFLPLANTGAQMWHITVVGFRASDNKAIAREFTVLYTDSGASFGTIGTIVNDSGLQGTLTGVTISVTSGAPAQMGINVQCTGGGTINWSANAYAAQATN